MSALAGPRGGQTVAGRIVVPLLALAGVVTLALVLGVATGIVPNLVGWAGAIVGDNLGVLRFLGAATAVLLFTVPTAFVIIYLEMKVIALQNLRLGPNRVGPWGTLQSTIHGFKVLSKEDFTPTAVDVPVYTLAPAVVYLGAVMAFLVLPFAPGLYAQDLNIGLLYFFAVGGMGVVGLMMAGWASFNKYSLLGALRAAAQVISYEIPLTLSVVGVIMLAGTLSLDRIVQQQAGWFLDWNVFKQPLAFVIFFIAATAEGNRSPFDLAEADSEIVAGPFTEYSGMRFGFFFFAEYVQVFILSALTVTLFFGGWASPLNLKAIFDALHITLGGGVDLGSLGLGLLVGLLVVPPLLVGLLAVPFWMLLPRLKAWQALVLGFVALNVLLGGLITVWALLNFEAVVGIFWFLAKTYVFVVTFVWMRATLPRVRIDQLMGFAWKWLLPASLVNLFVTAAAILIVRQLR